MRRTFGLLFIFFGVILLLKVFVHTTPEDWFSSSSGHQAGTVSVSKVHAIEIEANSANIHVIPRNRDRLTADLKGAGSLTVHRKGDNVEIKVDDSWFGWLPIGKKTSLDVYVPANYHKNMDFQLKWGNVHIDGKSKNNPMALDQLKLDMNAGNVALHNLHVQTLKQQGSAGNVHLHRVSTEKTFFHLSAGNVQLDHFTGALNVDLSAGNLKAQMDQVIGPIKVNSSAGNVVLDLPKQAAISLNAEVSHGKVQCGLPLQGAVISDHHIKGNHGSGKYPVNVSVSVGNIRVK